MVVSVAPLVADGGQIRLVRRVAAYVYGSRDVIWPEDVDDPKSSLPDSREFGWVAQLDGPRPGLSGRRFVRADASIDAVEGVSNTEQLLDDAAERAGGDVHFETVIRGRGLAGQEPGVDFRLGDRVPARFWQRLLPGQLVTEVGWDDQGAYAKLGGQMLRDLDALSRTRSELVRTIKKEREEAAGEVKAVRAYADQRATSAESSAKSYALTQAQLAERNSKSYTDSKHSALSATLNSEITGLNQQIINLGDQTTRERLNAMEALNQKIKDLDQSVTVNAQAQMKVLNQDMEKLNANLTLLKQQDINDLQQKWNAQQGELNAQNDAFRKLQGEFNAEQTKINRQGDEFRKLQSQINDRQTGINALNDKFQAQQRDVNALNDNFRSQQTELNNRQSDINTLNSKFREETRVRASEDQKLWNKQNSIDKRQDEQAKEIDRRAMRMAWARDDMPFREADWGWVDIRSRQMEIQAFFQTGKVGVVFRMKSGHVGTFMGNTNSFGKFKFGVWDDIQECLFLFVPD